MVSSPEAKTIRFLTKLSLLYKDSLPIFSRHLNLDSELLLDTPTYSRSRCTKHCQHCYVSLDPGVNCSVRSRSSKQLKALQKNLILYSVSGYGQKHIVFGKRNRSFWTIRCRECKALFVDFSQRLFSKHNRRGKGKMDKSKAKVSRKKRAKNANIEKTKKRMKEKQNLQALMPKPKSLKDFLIACDVKID